MSQTAATQTDYFKWQHLPESLSLPA